VSLGVARLARGRAGRRRGEFDETVEELWVVISFEMFHALAGPGRTFEEVAPKSRDSPGQHSAFRDDSAPSD
jgi:hypothetical protein